jgi:hypothetical protein
LPYRRIGHHAFLKYSILSHRPKSGPARNDSPSREHGISSAQCKTRSPPNRKIGLPLGKACTTRLMTFVGCTQTSQRDPHASPNSYPCPRWRQGTMMLRAREQGESGFQVPSSHLMWATPPHCLVWRHEWPLHITSLLLTDSNPSGSITNSDLELAGGLLHLDALAQSFDIPSVPKTTTSARHFGNGKETCPPLPRQHTSYDSLASTNASIDTSHVLTTFPALPTMSPIPSHGIFIYHGLTSSPLSPTSFHSQLVVKSRPPCRRSFPR